MLLTDTNVEDTQINKDENIICAVGRGNDHTVVTLKETLDKKYITLGQNSMSE